MRLNLLALFLLLSVPGLALAQPTPIASRPVSPFDQPPQEFEILNLRVEGVEDESMVDYVYRLSGLYQGQQVTIPGDPAFSNAIKQLYGVGSFQNVEIIAEKTVGTGVHLVLRVEPVAQMASYAISGLKKSYREEIKEDVPLVVGRPARTPDIERTRQVIKDYLSDKGFLLATVEVNEVRNSEGQVVLDFVVERGPKVEIGAIQFVGNEEFSDRKLRSQLEDTKQEVWWKFWRKSRFDAEKFAEDKERVVEFYNSRGYYDARVVRDSVYLDTSKPDDPEIVVQLTVEEGPQYHIRHIEWVGNTVYPDAVLTEALGVEEGDVYNAERISQRLAFSQDNTDVTSLYYDTGYIQFNVNDIVTVTPGDSLDLTFEIFEGDIYEFGDIRIAGNTKTKDYVIRRQLRTLPGQTFSRAAIQRSIRDLVQLNYFDQEGLGKGPDVVPGEDKTVDLVYNVTETGGDQIELSGGWGGSQSSGGLGLLLQARVTFNNFSIQKVFDAESWRPLPSGDGQQLSLGVQLGGYYQNYHVSFTEPWFRTNRPTPFSVSLSHSRYDYSNYRRNFFSQPDSTRSGDKFSTTSARIAYGQQLAWPDDFFQTSTSLGYQLYSLQGGGSFYGLPQGTNQELTIMQRLTRNSTNNPIFPTAGSNLELSLEIAPPLPNFVQYWKAKARTDWYVPIYGKLALKAGGQFGYLGSLTGESVEFQRFLVGGTPMQAQYIYGKDLVFMRGYPIQVISPRRGGAAIGGRVLNQYTSELSLVAVTSPQFQLQPYLFFDAANTWSGFNTYNPFELYRSGGVGARIFLPILGMLDLTYGYNFDRYQPLQVGDDGRRRWHFQFTLGQSF